MRESLVKDQRKCFYSVNLCFWAFFFFFSLSCCCFSVLVCHDFYFLLPQFPCFMFPTTLFLDWRWQIILSKEAAACEAGCPAWECNSASDWRWKKYKRDSESERETWNIMITPPKGLIESLHPRIISCQTGFCSAGSTRGEDGTNSFLSRFFSLFTLLPVTQRILCEKRWCVAGEGGGPRVGLGAMGWGGGIILHCWLNITTLSSTLSISSYSALTNVSLCRDRQIAQTVLHVECELLKLQAQEYMFNCRH